ECLYLCLSGQIIDDGLVGFQPAQDIRTHELPQRSIRVVPPLCKLFREAGKLLRGSEQSRIDEVEDRPQIAQTIFNRRTGQRDSRPRVELLDEVRLLR